MDARSSAGADDDARSPPPAGPGARGSSRKFGVRRRRFGGDRPPLENARDGLEPLNGPTTDRFRAVASRVGAAPPPTSVLDTPDFDFSGRPSPPPPVTAGRTRPDKYASPALIRPGASIMHSDEERRLQKNYNPPTASSSFIQTLTSLRSRTAAPVASKRTLEEASAPRRGLPLRVATATTRRLPPPSPSPLSPIASRSSSNTNNSTWTATRRSGTTEKPRISLTPVQGKRPAPAPSPHDREAPTRSSPRLRGPSTATATASPASAWHASPPPSATPSSANTRQSSRLEVVAPRRKSRRIAQAAAHVDGTADMPIHLDSESEADSQDERAAAKDLVAPEELETIEVDEIANEKDAILVIKDARAWLGTRACYMNLVVRDRSIGLCAIRGVGTRRWTLDRNVMIYASMVKKAYFYRRQESCRPESDILRIMAATSFLALAFTVPRRGDKKVWREFFDLDSPDPAKRFLIIVPPDADKDGQELQTIQCILETKPWISVENLYEETVIRSIIPAILANNEHSVGVPRPGHLRRRRRRGHNSDDEESVVLTYPLPPCTTDIVTITRQDVARLKPENYLNDNIIDYYFKRLLLVDHQSDEMLKRNVLFLSSHFYSRLRAGKGATVVERLASGYENVATWLSRSDFFNRSIIVVPINKDMHWSMALILNPRSAGLQPSDEDVEAKTWIALLDPLGSYHRKAVILRNLQSFLRLEWENTHTARGDREYRERDVKAINVKAPRQENSFDCGVYVLKYAEVILQRLVALAPAGRGRQSTTEPWVLTQDLVGTALETLMPPDAFSAEDICAKRKELEELLAEDAATYERILDQEEEEAAAAVAVTKDTNNNCP